MPWGWECRGRLVKQVPPKPTERRGDISGQMPTPGPNHYEPPQIFCGKGFDRIKRAPAYTFGHLTKASFAKPITTPYAPMFNVQNLGRKGPYRVTHSVVTPHIEPITDKSKKPGPATYAPPAKLRYKRSPAYTMQPAARPPYQPWDMWTPPPNMYSPPVPGKKVPAYTLGYTVRHLSQKTMPGPGDHDPNFDYVKRNKPAYSFGAPFKRLKPPRSPPPNIYCEKKFMYTKRTIPASTFGIRHSPYIGQQEAYLKPSNLNLVVAE